MEKLAKYSGIVSDEAFKQLLQACAGAQERLMAIILRDTGIRVNEAIRLQMKDIYLDEKMLVIESHGCIQGRWVFLTERTIEALREYMAVRGPGNTYLFVTQSGIPLNKAVFLHHFNRARRSARSLITPYALRRTWLFERNKIDARSAS